MAPRKLLVAVVLIGCAPDDVDESSNAQGQDAAIIEAARFPDSLACGESAVAEIDVRNTGDTTWTSDYALAGVGGDPFHAAGRMALTESVPPGASHTFVLDLSAPNANGTERSDWRMQRGDVWFGDTSASDVEVTCAVPTKRTGLVQLDGNSLVDDQGKFNALGATMMWAAWGYKFDRARLEDNLAFLAEHGFHYIRALGVVGDYDEADHWDGREIDWHWPDYAEVIAGLTDLAYDEYGLRVEWTLIGDGQKNIPESADRYALVDTFVAMSQGREQKIIHFEIANEAWQNGFGESEGIAELRALSQYMKDLTPILVAASAPLGHECADQLAVYEGGIADIATIHFDRDVSLVDGPWRPVRQPWEHVYCEPALPVGSNNEPIGPGSSVVSEEDPVRLVAGAITTYVSNLPLHVFHSSAGVRGDENLWEMSGADAFVHVNDIVPGDLASWERKNAHWPDAPFRVYAEENGQPIADTMWPDLAEPTAGAVRAYGGVNGNAFFVFPIGILNRLIVEARQNMAFDVIDPMTGAILSSHVLAAGEQLELSGHEALVLSGTFQ